MVKKELLDRAMRQFISEQVMTLSQLEPLLSCSQRSVQRYLSKWGALRSYNHNGKYFSLPVIARFDSFGVWKYQDISRAIYPQICSPLPNNPLEKTSGSR